MMGLQLGLFIGAQKSGPYVPDTTGPVVTDIVWSAGKLSFIADEDCTVYALHNASATLMLAAAIQSGAEVTQAIAAGDGEFSLDDAAWGAGTWYLHVMLKDADDNTTVLTPVAHVIAVPGFTETWASYVVGNNFAQLDAAYSRTHVALPNPVIVADAQAPSGKALRCSPDTAGYNLWRDDISAELALRTTERVQVLQKFRFVSSSTFQRGGVGSMNGSLFTGIRLARPGVDANEIRLQHAADINGSTNTSVLLSGLTDLSSYWVRMEVDGLVLRARAWAHGASEPGTWVTRTEAAAVSFLNLTMAPRNGAPAFDLLGYSIGIGADAPVI